MYVSSSITYMFIILCLELDHDDYARMLFHRENDDAIMWCGMMTTNVYFKITHSFSKS